MTASVLPFPTSAIVGSVRRMADDVIAFVVAGRLLAIPFEPVALVCTLTDRGWDTPEIETHLRAAITVAERETGITLR